MEIRARRRTFVLGLTAAGAALLALPQPVAADAASTYDASGDWHAAVHNVGITGVDGSTVVVPVRVYALGAQNLAHAVNAQLTHTTSADGRGGTAVQLRIVVPSGGRAFPANAAIRIADGGGRLRMVAQTGGTSGSPLTLRFTLSEAQPR